MSFTQARAHEAQYMIIVKSDDGHTILKQWAKEQGVQGATFENNRMKLYESASLHKFMVTYRGNWSNILIWDCWNRRHIDQI